MDYSLSSMELMESYLLHLFKYKRYCHIDEQNNIQFNIV